jgi:tellurite methyltransferase
LSRADRDKWDARYRDGAYADRTHPCALLGEWLPSLPRGRALDLACGAGRNALALAAAGWQVDGVDISEIGLARARATAAKRGLTVRFLAADLEAAAWPAVLGAQRYDLIVWIRYVNPHLMAAVRGLLTPGGCLLCEQHIASTEPVAGPRSPRYRLAPQSLLKSATGLRVIYYREGLLQDPDGCTAALAQLIACNDSEGPRG